MTKKNETNAVDAAPKSNGGLLASLNLAAAVFRTREEVAQDIVDKGNGEIVKLDKLTTLVETITYTDDYGEEQSFESLRVEMPAGAIKLVAEDDDTYSVQRATKPFTANASYASKMHKDGKSVLCELVAPGETSLMSEKTNDNEYMIVLYHIL